MKEAHQARSWARPTVRKTHARSRAIVERGRVEDAGERHAIRLQLGVLEVDVLDRRAERRDHGQRVHPLPEQVGRIEVRADDRSDRLAHPHQGRHVEDEVERMELERDVADPGRRWHAGPSPPRTGSRSPTGAPAAARRRRATGRRPSRRWSPRRRRPGVPDMDTTVSTPSSPASRIVSRTIRSCSAPRTGWSGHAEQLSAAIVRPRELNASAKARRLVRSPRSSSSRRCGARDWPPPAISIDRQPTSAARSRAASKGRSATELVYRHRSIEATPGVRGEGGIAGQARRSGFGRTASTTSASSSWYEAMNARSVRTVGGKASNSATASPSGS